jgi:hypothetical protein
MSDFHDQSRYGGHGRGDGSVLFDTRVIQIAVTVPAVALAATARMGQ